MTIHVICAALLFRPVETALLESMATEHGMVLQNLALMTEVLGLEHFK